MRVSIIVAMAHNRVIGTGNRLPWHLPDDLKHFKRITSGHPVIMGRKTFESIGKALPGRENIVISRRHDLVLKGARIAPSLEDALRLCHGLQGADEVFIIGGAQIYSQALPLAQRLYLTLIDADVQGDAYFPEIPTTDFREVSREESTEGMRHYFVVMDRLQS